MQTVASLSSTASLVPRRITRVVAAKNRSSTSTRVVASSAGPGPMKVTWKGGSVEVSGSGATLGSGADADAVVDLPGVGAAHLKLEVKQGRVFVTALKDGGTVTIGDSPLFPEVAYAVKEGARLGLGDEGSEVSVEQVDGGGGTAGVDMMSKMMQMQFEATLKPEIKKALEIKRRE